MVVKKFSSRSPSPANFTFPYSPSMELTIALFSHFLNFHLFFPKSLSELKNPKRISWFPLNNAHQANSPFPSDILWGPLSCCAAFACHSFSTSWTFPSHLAFSRSCFLSWFSPWLCGTQSIVASLGSVHGR